MNYRHAFHAGNFADVFKHALLARMLIYLMRKDAPLHFIDTHAGIGLYDLAGAEAARTGEWRGGIARLAGVPDGPARDLLAPYLRAVGGLDGQGRPALYPGSPALAQALLRPQDRMSLCEMHPDDAQLLTQNMGRDRRAKVIEADGYAALNALVPPRERRGLVLIDPPFEADDEFARMQAALLRAQRKWREGVFALWYPVKDAAAGEFARRLAASGLRRILRLQLRIGDGSGQGLQACGLIVLNPPFALEAEAALILPALAQAMGAGGGGFGVDWLAGE